MTPMTLRVWRCNSLHMRRIAGGGSKFGRPGYCANVAGIIVPSPPTNQYSTAVFHMDEGIYLPGMGLRAMLG
jgi:hypothetical protein